LIAMNLPMPKCASPPTRMGPVTGLANVMRKPQA